MLTKTIKQSLTFIPPFKKVIVGVSGGADSVALAHILMKLGYEITIAHLNHGLRGKESDADEKFVKNLAKKWKVPCVTHKIQLSAKGNLENQARLVRYAFLEKVRQDRKAKFIAVAHHLDDQIETILMHMMRGAGLRGLCGMKLRNDKIIRPLLIIRKQELIDYLKKEKIGYQIDKSNFNTQFRRNFLRHEVIPKLRKKDKNFEDKLLQLSESAQKRLVVIEKQAKQWIMKAVKNQQFNRLSFLALSDDVKSEVLFLLAGRQNIYSQPIQKIKDLIRKGATGKQKQIGPLTFETRYDKVVFYKEVVPVEKLGRIKLKVQEIRWGNWKLQHKGSDILYVRAWQKGDRFKPAGMKGTKKLQDFFVDQKIPKSERHQIPIVVDENDKILSVGNFRFDRKALKRNLKKKLIIHLG